MDIMLTAAADALARRAMNAEYGLHTPAEEDAYYARHIVRFVVPAWISLLLALARRDSQPASRRAPAARHA
jgi:hypothetical protein